MALQQLIAGISGFTGILMLILDGKTAIRGAVEGISLCIQTIIPSLFPFFLFSILLTGAFVGSPLPILRPIGKLFRIPKDAESILIASFLGGYPVGAQAVSVACRNGQLSPQDADRMIAYCSNAGPSFLFGILAFMFPEAKDPWILWGIHILSAWMVSRLFSEPYSDAKLGKSSISISAAMTSAVKTMAWVCGWVVLFRVILAFVDRWFFFMLDTPWQVAITGILELSNGCCSLNQIENMSFRLIIASCMLALGGICVTMQTASVTQGLSMKYYLIGKLLQCVFSLILSLSYIFKLYWIPVLLMSYFGFFSGKIKNSGSNPKKAVV